MSEVEGHDVLTGINHLVAELLLREAIETLVCNHGVLATLAGTVEVGNAGLATLHGPILEHIGRAVDILTIKVGLVDSLAICLEVVVLIGEPIGVDKPEHPLTGHLIKSRAAPCITYAIGRYLQLERMAQLVCHAVEFLILYTVGSNPQSSNEVVVCTTVCCTIERVIEHHHHFIFVGFGARQGEAQGIAIIGIE